MALNTVDEIKLNKNNSFQTFASALSRPALFPMPEFIVDLIFGKERGALLTTGAKITPKRAIELGFKFTYPSIDEACKELVNVKRG